MGEEAGYKIRMEKIEKMILRKRVAPKHMTRPVVAFIRTINHLEA